MVNRCIFRLFGMKAWGAVLVVFTLMLTTGCGDTSVKSDAVAYAAPEGEPLQGNAVLESAQLKLSVLSGTGIITVTDKRNGFVWSSAANDNELKGYEIPGDYKGHVQSPFIVEYLDVKTSLTNYKRGNLISEKPEVRLYSRDNGVEAAFSLKGGDLKFSFVLGLSGDRLTLDIPGNRIQDNAKTAVLRSIQPYPFLGAALGKTKPGYILIPSGPGYLMDFYDFNYPYSSAFYANIFGYDYGFPLGENRPENVDYPVFGIKQDRNAFVAVMDRGAEYAKVMATPSGLNTPYNWATSEFMYLPEDYLKNPYSTQSKQFISDYAKHADRRVEFTFLVEERADYVGMAKAYRSHLLEGGARKMEPAGKVDPLMLRVFQAGSELGAFGRKAVPVTTFAQAKQMVEYLYGKGVGSMNVSLVGWNDGGAFPGRLPKRLPPEPSLGTVDDMKALADYSRSLGIPLMLFDNYLDATSKGTGFKPRRDASRNIRTGVVEFKGNSSNLNSQNGYMIRPGLALNYLQDAIPAYQGLGIGGLVLFGQSPDLLQSDFHKGSVFARSDSMNNQTAMLDTVNRELGLSGYGNASAYAAGRAQFLYGFPISPAYEVLAGETVPFYSIAVHGLSGYVGREGNLAIEPKTARLRSIEYGALPYYTVTHDPTSELRFTSDRWWLTSSRFDLWKDEIVSHYGQYRDRLGSAMHLFIEDHRQLAEQVFATVYEDGRQVVVNYSARPFRYGGTEVAAHDYAVVSVSQAAPAKEGK